MKNRVFNYVVQSKTNFIREFTLDKYGYLITEDKCSKLAASRNLVFDKLLCEYTNDKFNYDKPKDLNLHRWNLENRDKTKNEYEYPW